MINPDLNPIKVNEPGKRSYDSRIGEERPVGVPQTKKEFNVLLRKDSDKEDEAETGNKVKGKPASKKVKADPESESKASIFSLSATKKTASPLMDDEQPLIADSETELPETTTPEESKIIPMPEKKVVAPVPKEIVPLKENPKTTAAKGVPNLFVKEEKPLSDAQNRPVKGKMKQDINEEHYQPIISAEKEDVSNFMGDSGAEKHSEMPKKKEIVPTIVAYRTESEPVPIVNNAKAAPVIERPEVPKELPSIFSPAFAPKKEEKITTKFSVEQPDLAYVNPMHMSVQATTSPLMQTATERPAVSNETYQLFAQLVSHMTTLNTQGKTETTMVLKNPPIFEGASLKITSVHSAHGEFNITFENLKPEALKIMQDQGDSLKQALQNKGFTVHILTATSVAENPIHTAEANIGRDQREQQQQQQQGQQKQQQEEEES